MIRVKRIHDPPAPDDGKRYLADRIWPRGVSRAQAALDGWLKNIAPSDALRRWYGHDPARWEEFGIRYRDELSRPEAAQTLAALRLEAVRETVTLLFAAKDRERNNAVVLKECLDSPPES